MVTHGRTEGQCPVII